MAKIYMVRQPILGRDQKLLGYEILYNSDAKESSENSEDMTVESFITQAKAETFLDGEAAFLTFSPNLLFRKVPDMFHKDKLVIQIDETTMMFPEAKAQILEYREKGYRIALCGFDFTPRHFHSLDMVDYIKLNFQNDVSSYQNIIDIARKLGKEIIGCNINRERALELAQEMDVSYLQGTIVGKPKQLESNAVDFLQSNFMQFMAEVMKEDPDLDVLDTIISRDVSLAYALIRLVNSAYFAMRSKATTVKEAIVILGITELKKWVYLLSFRNIYGDGMVPTELIRTSFLRANFCADLVGMISDIEITLDQGYIMGMFSTLDLLTGIPLHIILEELSMPEVIKQALITKTGTCGMLYELIISYESGHWARTTQLSQKLGMNMDKITSVYFACVENVNKTWHEVMTVPNPAS